MARTNKRLAQNNKTNLQAPIYMDPVGSKVLFVKRWLRYPQPFILEERNLMIRLMGTAVATAALGLGLVLSPARAATSVFIGVNADQQLSGQLSVDVTQLGGAGGNIQFVFRNTWALLQASRRSISTSPWPVSTRRRQHHRKQCRAELFGRWQPGQSARWRRYFIRG